MNCGTQYPILVVFKKVMAGTQVKCSRGNVHEQVTMGETNYSQTCLQGSSNFYCHLEVIPRFLAVLVSSCAGK